MIDLREIDGRLIDLREIERTAQRISDLEHPRIITAAEALRYRNELRADMGLGPLPQRGFPVHLRGPIP